MEINDLIFCPYTSNVCPGPAKCAPAVFAARHVDKEGGHDEGTTQSTEPVCPITAHVLYMRNISTGLYPLVYGFDKALEDEEKKATMSERDRVLGELKLDGDP